MKVLEYEFLDISRVSASYRRVKAQLERDDTKSADLKKLTGSAYFRAKLDDTNRLLLQIVRHRGERFAVALEIIGQHAYDRSRFLNGAVIDESKIEEVSEDLETLPEVTYLNPATTRIHVLDKILSFDDVQDAVYRTSPPLILIGSAGSGKTALTLEKLKQASGDVLFVTRSAFLARHARDLYFSRGFRADYQEISFLSLSELIGTLRIPDGNEVRFTDFRKWFERHRQTARHISDAHALFEEFRGVITGASLESPWLSREQYRALGVRRSIFLDEARDEVYDLFGKYVSWLEEAGLHDANIVAQERLGTVVPRYDFIVADEAQDLTSVELALVLKLLRKPGQFVLCGDSNQIVHPNFFSWANVKTLFFEHEDLAPGREIAVLRANYRNSVEVTQLANRLLRLKTARFGSIDRESQYEVIARPTTRGEVELVRDDVANVAEIDSRTRRSRRFAVIVLRDEDKPEASKRFHTPLLFSVHEAKGLEYDNVILFNVVSNCRSRFDQIIEGVDRQALDRGQDYSRAGDKRDKSLELLKFYINALYVSLTRAVTRIIWIESDAKHGIFPLLGLGLQNTTLHVKNDVSNLEEWQQEARKLELQGKQEQADSIRKSILANTPVPWQVLDRKGFRQIVAKALDPKSVSSKMRKELLEYTMFFAEADVVERLISLRFVSDASYAAQHPGVLRKHLAPYLEKKPLQVLSWVERHGIEFRSPLNFTPLMLATLAGNRSLVDTLIERGADTTAFDNFGRTAFHHALMRAGDDERFASKVLPELWHLLAPSGVTLSLDGRLLRLDASQIEYVLFNLMFQKLREYICPPHGVYRRPGLSALQLLDAVNAVPAHVISQARRRRSYLSGVLARNEVARDYAWNRRLFLRVQHGLYVLNPRLRMQVGEQWTPVYDLMDINAVELPGFGLREYASTMIESALRYLDSLASKTTDHDEGVLHPVRSDEESR